MTRGLARTILVATVPLLLLPGHGEAQPAPAGAPAQNAAGQEAAYVPGEILIKFKPGVETARKLRIQDDVRAVRRRRFRSGAELWRLGPGLTTEQAIARLRRHPSVQYVEPNALVHTLRFPSDPSFFDQWGLFNFGQSGGTYGADIDAVYAWNVTTGSRAVVVAVIDSGIDYGHPDLSANMYTNAAEIPDNGEDDDQNGFVDDVRGWDFRDDDNDPWDELGHGTHVAGIIGAVGGNFIGVTGVSWEVTLLPLRFIGIDGSGSVGDAVEAVEYATQAGADIINASWGSTGFSPTLREAFVQASEAGVLTVAAAGNDSSDNDLVPHYPSSFDVPGLLAVSATDHSDLLAVFSNFGTQSVDLAAPGQSVLSTLPSGGYGRLSGTSMAAPHAAGVAALLRALAPRIDAVALRDKLIESVDPLPGLAGRSVSGGRLNALRCLSNREMIAPGACTDLAASSPGSFSLALTWTATGDDGATGTAASYDIRYSTAPFDDTGFSSLPSAQNPPLPLPAGGLEHLEVIGLRSSTTYYFALKAIDDWGNAGPMSNLAAGTTLDPPDIGVTPEALSADLLTNEIASRALTIRNSGAGPLSFHLSLRAAPPSAAASRLDVLLLHSGADLVRIRALFREFPDIGSVDLLDGRGSPPALALLRPYRAVILATDDPWPDPVAIGNALAAYAEAGGRAIVLVPSSGSWPLSGRLEASGSAVAIEVPSGAIDAWPDDTASILHEAVLDSAAVPWLSVDPSSGVLPPGGQMDVVVTFDATERAGGDYGAALVIASDDPDESEIAVPLHLHVTSVPDISLSTTSLDFGSLFVGASRSASFTVRNEGTDVLDASLTAIPSDFVPDATSLTVPAGKSEEVVVTFRPSLAAIREGTLTVRTNDPDEGVLTVLLQGAGLPPPDIDTATASVGAGLSTGQATTRTVTLRNAGGSALQFGALTRLGTRAAGVAGPSPPAPAALVIQGLELGRSQSSQQVLSANGFAYDFIAPAQLAVTDLSAYSLVLVPDFQTTASYSILAAQADRLSRYVAAGGVLEFHAADTFGDASLVTLPGGVRIHHLPAGINRLLADHPLTSSVPAPLYTSGFVSLSYFSGLPESATLIADDGEGRITLVEYPFGGGTVIAGGQSFDRGGAPGLVLDNMIRFAHELGPRWVRIHPSSGIVPPGGSQDILVTLDSSGLIGGGYEAHLVVSSNDPDEPVVVIPARIEVNGAPDIAAAGTLTVTRLHSGRATTRSLSIENSGLFDLRFEVVPAYAASPAAAGSRSLEGVLQALKAGVAAVRDAIPGRFDFSGAGSGIAIDDGGGDMYDGGNILYTSLGGPLLYSNNVIRGSSLFGAHGRYFTLHVPGLFVLAADLDGIDSFSVEGDLGADGFGAVNASLMELRWLGVRYRILAKRVYYSGRPSVNHLVILPDSPLALHEYSASTNDDHHKTTGLRATRRLYYLVYAGRLSSLIDDSSTLSILRAFLETLRLAPPWLTIEPATGVVPPGGRTDIAVTFDARDLLRGDYDAGLVIASDDPDAGVLALPAHVQVVGPLVRRGTDRPERPRSSP
jgi:subtilisin family serine protease